MTAPTATDRTPSLSGQFTRRRALALIAAVPVAIAAAGSLQVVHDNEANRRVMSAGLALVACWSDAESRLTGDAYILEAGRGTVRIIKDLDARYGTQETVRILREVTAIMKVTLGGPDVA